MTKITNPYIDSPNKRVEFLAGKDDLHELRSRLPRHGVNDAVISVLFHRFITQLRDLVPVATSAAEAESNETRIHDILVTFKLHA